MASSFGIQPFSGNDAGTFRRVRLGATRCKCRSRCGQAAGGARAEVTGGLGRGDLVFWKGHVALVVDGARLIHANGFTMSVA